MAETILPADPKAALASRMPQSAEDQVLLETVASNFCEFINHSCAMALEDATTNIDIPYREFQEQEE